MLTMPSMAMPPTVIRTARAADGAYEGSGSFTMDGDWQAEITATASGRRTVQKVSVTVQ
ncbi:MAG: FixH family protein [Armatimonadota bacterium]|nr:FixH family protein [Armatimonadota bacterium]